MAFSPMIGHRKSTDGRSQEWRQGGGDCDVGERLVSAPATPSIARIPKLKYPERELWDWTSSLSRFSVILAAFFMDSIAIWLQNLVRLLKPSHYSLIFLFTPLQDSKSNDEKNDKIPTEEWRHAHAAKLQHRSDTELARLTVVVQNCSFTRAYLRIGQTLKPGQEHKVRCPDTSAHCSCSRQYRGAIAKRTKHP